MYAYCLNNPVLSMDPTGEMKIGSREYEDWKRQEEIKMQQRENTRLAGVRARSVSAPVIRDTPAPPPASKNNNSITDGDPTENCSSENKGYDAYFVSNSVNVAKTATSMVIVGEGNGAYLSGACYMISTPVSIMAHWSNDNLNDAGKWTMTGYELLVAVGGITLAAVTPAGWIGVLCAGVYGVVTWLGGNAIQSCDGFKKERNNTW